MVAVVVVAVALALIAGRTTVPDPSSAATLTVPPTSPTAPPAATSEPVTSTTGTTPATTVTTTTTSEPRSATLAFSGDIITHLAVGREGRRNAQGTDEEYDFDPLFQYVAPTITNADLAICHLETTLSRDGRFTGFPRFSGPHQLADAIAGAGFDGCSLASNHAYDFLEEGIDSTIATLENAGLQHAGTARSAAEAERIVTYDVNGIAVAHLSYTYWINGFESVLEDDWRVNLLDSDAVIAEANEARRLGAEFVVASLHWGEEYRRTPTEDQRRWAEEIAAAGVVDLIVGHHAHVIQPIDTIGDTLVLYGLGNFLSNQEPTCCTIYSMDGVVVEVAIADRVDGEDGVAIESVEFTPTWMDRSRMQILPVVERMATDDELPTWMRNAMEASRTRTAESLTMLGRPLPDPR